MVTSQVCPLVGDHRFTLGCSQAIGETFGRYDESRPSSDAVGHRHRMIKPENVIRCRICAGDDRYDITVVVADLGSALMLPMSQEQAANGDERGNRKSADSERFPDPGGHRVLEGSEARSEEHT